MRMVGQRSGQHPSHEVVGEVAMASERALGTCAEEGGSGGGWPWQWHPRDGGRAIARDSGGGTTRIGGGCGGQGCGGGEGGDPPSLPSAHLGPQQQVGRTREESREL